MNLRDVIDADLSDYFNTIPHGSLMKGVARRISDRQILSVIKIWLVAPVTQDAAPRRRPPRVRGERREGHRRGEPFLPCCRTSTSAASSSRGKGSGLPRRPKGRS